MILMITGDGMAVTGVDSDMAVSSVENYGSIQYSVTGEQGMRTESRELTAGMDRNSGMGVGLERMVMRWRGKARWKMQLFTGKLD
jgi:aminopeptidase C